MSDISQLMISGVAPMLYPTTVYFGVMWDGDEDGIELPLRFPYKGKWGEIMSYDLVENQLHAAPGKIQLAWVALCEKQSYYIDEVYDSESLSKLLDEKIEGRKVYTHIVIGMAPFGGLALWVAGKEKCTFFKWLKAAKIDIPMNLLVDSSSEMTIGEYCDSYLNLDSEVADNLREKGMPEKNGYDKLMVQYNYRLKVQFMTWNGSEWAGDTRGSEYVTTVESISIERYDGTFDRTGKYEYERYVTAGKPKTLKVRWRGPRGAFTAVIWIDYEDITDIFSRFYGAHPHTNADLILNIDSANNKYELALYRQGLKEPLILSESTYQLIVFKNKFEYFRSHNYNQPKGAWIG